MLVKFAMDTKQILANATTIFWMHSFISGHKKSIQKPGFHRTRYSFHYPSISGEPNILLQPYGWQLEHRQRRVAAASRGDSVVLPLIHRKVSRDVHKCTTIHIVYRIVNPIYHNSRPIITQITYCTDSMLLLQIPKIVRCDVADMCNEKTVIIQFQ